MTHIPQVSRRAFLGTAAGLTVGFHVGPADAQ